MLYKWLAAPVCLDLVIALVFSLTSPPVPTIVPSLISVSRFEMFCSSGLSLPFMVIGFALKIPFLMWGLYLSWSTRTIISELNESSHILLSMINMFFVLCYVCVIQFLITDSQTALVMLRSLGTFVATTFTLIIVLGPKAARLLLQGDVPNLKASLDKRRSGDRNSRLGSTSNSTIQRSSQNESNIEMVGNDVEKSLPVSTPDAAPPAGTASAYVVKSAATGEETA